MARAIVLTCPVCGATHAFVGDRDDHAKADLLAAVRVHLDVHELEESTRAIRKHQAVSAAEERILDDETLDALPTATWSSAFDAESGAVA